MKKTSPARRRLTYPEVSRDDRLTHYLFRYPAKFHAPVVRQLVRDYTAKGDLIYDPFCGSGTLLVEALVEGRSAIGSDVDPVAVLVSQVKSRPIRKERLLSDLEQIQTGLAPHRRSRERYEALQWEDISPIEFERDRDGLWLPAIPNLEHWFRRYVLIDMARIEAGIREADISAASRKFFWLVFASIIRTVSNADPVPVSGLEVTSHMKQRDKDGRVIDPFRAWDAAAAKAITDMGAFAVKVTPGVRASTFAADAAALPKRVRAREVSAVITSPPYHGAVDYYRRHQLEMYWLRLIADHDARLKLLDRYIGRTRVPNRHPLLKRPVELPAREVQVEKQMREVSGPRANAFRHYCVAMSHVFGELACVLPEGAPALFVVGHSTWRGSALNTSDLFAELALPHFQLDELLDYPVKNRYMSYTRHNGASIDHEYVLVLTRTAAQAPMPVSTKEQM